MPVTMTRRVPLDTVYLGVLATRRHCAPLTFDPRTPQPCSFIIGVTVERSDTGHLTLLSVWDSPLGMLCSPSNVPSQEYAWIDVEYAQVGVHMPWIQAVRLRVSSEDTEGLLEMLSMQHGGIPASRMIADAGYLILLRSVLKPAQLHAVTAAFRSGQPALVIRHDRALVTALIAWGSLIYVGSMISIVGTRWLRDWRKGVFRPGACTTCGYLVLDLPGRCPECGTSVLRRRAESPRTAPSFTS